MCSTTCLVTSASSASTANLSFPLPSMKALILMDGFNPKAKVTVTLGGQTLEADTDTMKKKAESVSLS